MLYPFAQFMTHRARLTRVCRINVIDTDPHGLGLVGNKVLQLPPRPPVESCSHPFPRLDPVTDMGQVLKTNFTGTTRYGLCHNSLGNAVVHMRNVTTLFTRDTPELLLRALGTVGLETTPMRQELVPIVPQFSTIKDPSTGSRSDLVLTHIHSKHHTTSTRGNVRYIKNQIEIPLALFTNQLCLSSRALVKEILLMDTHDKGHLRSATHGEQGKDVVLDRIGAFVKMHGLWTKLNQGYRFIFHNTLVRLQGLVGRYHFVNGITGHLTTETGENGPYRGIDSVVQGHPVKASMLLSIGHNLIASGSKLHSQVLEGLGLFRCGQEFD